MINVLDILLMVLRPWSPTDWTSSDDSVRGGSSYSEFSCNEVEPVATFCGNLDIKTLGGAGFASQRTTREDRSWDVSKYDGILLDIQKCDNKKYTLTIKDELLPRSSSGREQSTISWEYDFKSDKEGGKVYVRWDDLRPTYRGRDKRDAKPLDLRNVKRISLMMRRCSFFSVRLNFLTKNSFFGTQEGDFSLSVRSIAAFKKCDTTQEFGLSQGDFNKNENPNFLPGKASSAPKTEVKKGWFDLLVGHCLGS
jgi:hypothetical protein